MKAKCLLIATALFSVLTAGCKNDSEDDIPGWGNGQEKPDTASASPGDKGQVVINEVCGKQDPDDDWIELYNNAAEEKSLSGATIEKTDEEGKTETIFTFPDNYKIAGHGYAVIATVSGELQARISNKKEVALEIRDKQGNSIDKFDRDANIGEGKTHSAGESYARVPNGTGSWRITTATRGTANK